MHDKYIKLKDSRTLAFHEFGDLAGKPVLLFHGWPSCGAIGESLHRKAVEMKIRIIAPDRPGIGKSTSKPGRALLDWPNDVVELVDWLKIGKFSVIGACAGAPFAFACAYRIPDRVKSLVIAAGLGPIRDRKFLSLIPWKNVIFYRLAPLLIWLVRPALDYQRNSKHMGLASKVINLLQLDRPSEFDELALADKWYGGIQIRGFREALKFGVSGAVEDAKIYVKDWGFVASEIKNRVVFWHGDCDTAVPIAAVNYFRKTLPNVECHLLKDIGHDLFYNYSEEILKSVS